MKKTNYGIDAPGVIWSLLAGFLVSVGVAVFFLLYLQKSHPVAALTLFWLCLPGGIVMLVESILMIRSSRSGKAKVLPKLVVALELSRKERVLEIGCGSGQLLSLLAKAVPEGEAVGIDLWHGRDQSSSSKQVAQSNLEIEGVCNAELLAQDMQKLSFEDESFDAVAASLSIHNIHERIGREKALIEVSRVLKPGGRLAILDFQRISEYKETLEHLKWNNIEISKREYAMFPWVRILTATKPQVITE